MIVFTLAQSTCKYQDGKSYLKQKYTQYTFRQKLDTLAWARILTGVSVCQQFAVFF